MIYLASAYSAPDVKLEATRFEWAVEAVLQITHAGFHVFSPIVHWHTPATFHRGDHGGLTLPTDAAFWRTYNRWMIEHCEDFWMLGVPGWEQSIGVHEEIAYAAELGRHPWAVTFDELMRLPLADAPATGQRF